MCNELLRNKQHKILLLQVLPLSRSILCQTLIEDEGILMAGIEIIE